MSSLNSAAKLVVVSITLLLVQNSVFSQICGPFSIDRDVTDVICPGEADGAIDITVTGGAIPSYAYLWSNGETTEDISSLESGVFVLTITDFVGCSDTFHFEVEAPPYYNEFDKLVAGDRSPSDWFGFAVAISGDYAIVGAHREDEDSSGNNTLSSAGSVYFYKKDNNGVWNLLEKAVAPDRQVNDQFGYSVDIFGNYAIVGALLQDHDESGDNYLNESGAAYIYKLGSNGKWIFKQKIVASDRGALDRFSNSVAITDKYAVVGSFREDEDPAGLDTKSGAGSVYIFKRDSSDTFLEVQKIVANDRGPGDQFGWSVGVTGDQVLVGARLEDHDLNGVGVKTNSGSAYIFGIDSSGSWTQNQKLVASDRGAVDYFGHSVSISGNYLIISAVFDDDDDIGSNQLSNAGSVYFFRKDSVGVWTEFQKSVASDRAIDDQFGNAIDISGEFAIIGAWREEDTSLVNNSGSAYVFQLMNDGSWVELQKLTASDRAETDQFAISVSISGDFAIVGANLEDHDRDGINTKIDAGSAYIFGPTIELTADISNIGCSETNTGAIDLKARGGALPLEFLWSTGETTEDISDLIQGFYYVTATDTNGCSATASFEVDIKEDDSPPTISCSPNIITDTDTACFAFVDYDQATATDNCEVKSVMKLYGPDTGLIEVGTYSVSYVAEDSIGFKDTCEFTITVIDSENPLAVCPDSISDILLDSFGFVFLPANIGVGNSTDNCFVSESSPVVLFDCDDIGPQSVHLIASDSSGNSDTANCFFNVLDDVTPVAVCPESIPDIYLDNNGNAVIPANIGDLSSTDNCEVMETSPTTIYSCADIGSASVTLTVIDGSGNRDSIACFFNVLDTVKPSSVCPDSTVTLFLDNSGSTSLLANSINGNSSDNCSFTESNRSRLFTCADIGDQTYVLTATDSSSNLDSIVCVVRILDTIPPVVICKNISLSLDSTGVIGINAEKALDSNLDVCGIIDIQIDKSIFSCDDLGNNSIEVSVSDSSGNTSTCISIAEVTDTIKPIAVCRDSTVYIDSSGEVNLTVAEVDGGSYDACLDTLFLDESSFSCEEGGQKQITLTAMDKSGNFSSCISQITILDTINPIAKCKDTVVAYLNNMNVVKIPPSTFDAGSFDNCNLDRSVNKTSFTCLDIGLNNIRMVVMDPQGKSDSCAGILDIRESFKPVAMCRSVMTLALDSFGSVNVLPSDLDNGSADNCAIESLTVDIPVLTCVSNVVTLTVTDIGGNSSNCSTTIYTIDTLGPSVKCNDISITLDNNIFETVSVSAIDNGSFDGCGIDSIFLSQYTFGCADIGVNQEVMTVVDNDGNSSMCLFDVTVSLIDTVIAKCTEIQISLDSSGQETILPSQVDSGSLASLCGFTSSLDRSFFNCNDVGPQMVVLTVTDNGSGAQDTCHATVTVIDNIKPVMNCPDDTLILDENGSAILDKANLASDACGVQVFASQDSFFCADTGLQSIFVVASDPIGNFSICSFDLMVEPTDSSCPEELCLIPINLVSNTTYTSATLQWDPVPGATNYIVEGQAQGSNSTVQIGVDGNSITVTGLTPGTTYLWHVKTVCPSNSSDYSDIVSFTTLSCMAPGYLSTSNIQKKKAMLNWSAVPSSLGYRIFGGTGGQLSRS
ncbi:MAG: HYR domain-containing protein, partial [Bacteroidia bacterium]|nr:HYR domain-containing protein [Bacteroidia bacterium]